MEIWKLEKMIEAEMLRHRGTLVRTLTPADRGRVLMEVKVRSLDRIQRLAADDWDRSSLASIVDQTLRQVASTHVAALDEQPAPRPPNTAPKLQPDPVDFGEESAGDDLEGQWPPRA